MTEVTRSFCWHQNFVPWGLYAPALGLYTCIKSWKKMYKIRLQFLWNLQQMGKVIMPFCWHPNFVPWGLSAPARGYIHVLNHKTDCIKSDFEGIFFKTCIKWMKWQDISVDIKTLSPGGCLPLPRAIYMYKIMKKIALNQTSKRFFLKLATNDQSVKMFLLT